MKLTITIDEKDVVEHYTNFVEDNEETTITLADYKTAFEKALETTLTHNINEGWGFDLDNFIFEVENDLTEGE